MVNLLLKANGARDRPNFAIFVVRSIFVICSL